MPTRDALLSAATAFTTSFSKNAPPSEIRTHFTPHDSQILVHEHGLPQLAPFLGREYRGADGLAQYLAVVGECLTFADMRFPEYVVDAEARTVAVRGQARFTWKATGQSWDEVFSYVLGFDEDCKVERYEVWADSGAAYLASRGQL